MRPRCSVVGRIWLRREPQATTDCSRSGTSPQVQVPVSTMISSSILCDYSMCLDSWDDIMDSFFRTAQSPVTLETKHARAEVVEPWGGED